MLIFGSIRYTLYYIYIDQNFATFIHGNHVQNAVNRCEKLSFLIPADKLQIMTKKETVHLDRSDFIDVVKKTPLVSIDLIVKNNQQEILLGLRNNEPAKGFWFVPGGRILVNERITDAFQRIAHAELGMKLSIQDAKFLGVFEHFYNENAEQKPGFGTHYVSLAYEVNISDSIAQLPNDQHHQYKWMSIQNLLWENKVHSNTKAFFITP